MPAVDGLGDPQVSWLIDAGGRKLVFEGSKARRHTLTVELGLLGHFRADGGREVVDDVDAFDDVLVVELDDADERARLWPLVTADHKNYADYQTKTERLIPVFVLEPYEE